MKLYYSQTYVSSAYEFDTTRKAQYIAEHLQTDPVAGCDIVAPESVTAEQLLDVHEPTYVDSVRTGSPRPLAQSQGFDWDGGMWDAVRASTGGMVAAAMSALADGTSGTLSSGLHHARNASGSGFCTFNGLALAAIAAHRKTGGRVLILDLDAHCGGGTHEILGSMPWVRSVDVSVSPFDKYLPEGENTLDMVYDRDTYLDVIERRLAAVGSDFVLCLYNAGMDPYERCHIGGLHGITRGMLCAREEAVFAWCKAAGIPVAFAIAGGYSGYGLDMDGVVALHRMTIEAAASS